MTRDEAFEAIHRERERQQEKWGDQWGAGTVHPGLKPAILTEEIGEISRELCESDMAETAHLRKELTQAAAVCTAWLESLETEATEGEPDARKTGRREPMQLPATRKQLNYLEALTIDVLDGGTAELEEGAGKHLHELTREEASQWISRLSGRAV